MAERGPRRPLAERFWAKVDRGGPNDCWKWTASSGRDGYGRFGLGPKHAGWQPAHRMAYRLSVGAIPAGLLVCHHCDNRLCVNPLHLFLGTPKDNTQDMLRKGRAAATLTELEVRAIRGGHEAGISQRDLASSYGVSPGNVASILSRRTWSHIV